MKDDIEKMVERYKEIERKMDALLGFKIIEIEESLGKIEDEKIKINDLSSKVKELAEENDMELKKKLFE